MIKVVQISTFTTGGAGIAAYRLHQSLMQRADCESILVCRDAGIHKGEKNVIEVGPKPVTLKKRVLNRIDHLLGNSTNFGLEISAQEGNYELVSWPETHFNVELEQVIKEADIIHLHWVAEFINFPTFFSKLKKKKIVWTLHDMNPFMGIFHYLGDKASNLALRDLDEKAFRIKKDSLKKSNNICVVSLSEWIQKEAKKNEVFAKFNYKKIPNGVDVNVFKPTVKEDARNQLNLEKDSFVMLVVSENLKNYRKGLDILIDALPLLKTTTPTKIQVISVGGGELSVSGFKYKSFGKVLDEKKLAIIYSSADVFVMPSREDNLPNVMLEALACGTPVVGFTIGGQKDYILPLDTGVLAEEGSPASLAGAIKSLIDNYSSFDREKISSFAGEHFHKEKQLAAHYALYKELLGPVEN
ncbi:glycosyltransferase [Pedobacter frigiditerrae]|uniref:glycosyltransferase n=1 Tax=Pedobacter frigiditerrae TaxID=2530452 RepID=UPI002931D4B9|nr:glycosyltransferase [Pedobacter frigiditerrae]